MPRVETGRLQDKVTLESLQSQLDQLTSTVNGQLGFGDPVHPTSPAIPFGDVPAGNIPLVGFEDLAHNGTLDNIQGSWVEVQIEGPSYPSLTTSTHICYHNLYANDPDYVVPVANQPNCRWLVAGAMHDGFGANPLAAFHVRVAYVAYTTGLVTPTSISLQFGMTWQGPGPFPVDVFHPIRVTLFFIKATRGE